MISCDLSREHPGFMEPVFLDLEGTERGEIISVGAVCNNETFYMLVCPEHPEDITKRITELTGITKDMVKNEPKFDEVFEKLVKWMPQDSPVYVWGNFDRVMLKRTDENFKQNFRNIKLENIQNIFSRFLRPGKTQVGLQNAANILGIETEQAHNALGDAITLKKVVETLGNKSQYELLEMLKDNFPKLSDQKIAFMYLNAKKIFDTMEQAFQENNEMSR